MPQLENLRWEKFCQEYAKTPIGQSAAEATGYKSKTARVRASILLTKPEVIARIQELNLILTKENKVDASYVIKSIKKIADQLDAKTCDKLKALELLGKHLALFTDRLKVEGLPKRLIIRAESGEVAEELGATNANSND